MKKILVGVLAVPLMSGCALFNKKPDMVRVVDRVETGFTDEGLAVSPKRVRAWVEDIERDVAAATLITRVEEGQSINKITIDPIGSKVVFSLIEEQQAQNQTQSGFSGSVGKYSATLRGVPTNGGGISQLTTGRWLDMYPEYGPSGHITFASNRTRPDGIDIFRIDASRAGGVSMIRQTVDGYHYHPTVHPSGKMVFTFLPDYRRRGLSLTKTQPQLWSLGGGNPYPTQLREGSNPSLSPDGEKIVFTGVNGQLWTISTDGRDPVQLTSSAIPKDKLTGQLMKKKDATWSPDGEYIIFAAADGKDSENFSNYDIWMVSKEGRGLRQLTTNGSLDALPVVSHDQASIYFVSNRGFVEGIWKIPFPF